MADFVCFGDFMLRLNPPGYLKFIQANAFEANYTGAEANVAVSLAYMGESAALVTRVPDNDLGECGTASLRKYGVDVSHIATGGERLGIFFVEKGASQRPSKVTYDRMNSGFSTSRREDYDWNAIFDGARYFHFTGITPALGPNLAEICMEACQEAKRRGITVSCDLNYRKNLWTTAQAKAVMETLLPYVNILIANEEDAEKVLGIRADDTDVTAGKLSREGYIQVASRIHERFGCEAVTITLRKSISASENDWSGLLYTKGEAFFSREYRIHLVDRVGGGDSFGAGLLYSMAHGFDAQKTIEFAAAASCLKQTIEYDVNLSTTDDILRLAGGDLSGRVQR